MVAKFQPQPDAVKPVLKEIIEAAETVETGKMRNEALAAIESSSAKGRAPGATSPSGPRSGRGRWRSRASPWRSRARSNSAFLA